MRARQYGCVLTKDIGGKDRKTLSEGTPIWFAFSQKDEVKIKRKKFNY